MEDLIENIARARRTPRATYRLQFNRDFTFRDAAAVVDYLQELGVSEVYASPIFQARAGSTHGYDVCMFHCLNPELGGEEAFEQLSSGLRRRGMGVLLDIVPNHMGINDPANAWWLDVLEKGRCSYFTPYFDIDWRPPNPDLHDRVLLPFLGDHYGKALERGELKLAFENARFFVAYYENRFPLSPRSSGGILRKVAARLSEEQAAKALGEIASCLDEWPECGSPASAPNALRNKKVAACRKQLQSLAAHSDGLRHALGSVLAELNGSPGEPHSFDALDDILQEQHYRLAFWRVGPAEINYRRFFEITGLICLRMEGTRVFASVHQLVFRLLRENKITGLRIDHPDGLWNPEEYFFRLQEKVLLDRLPTAYPGHSQEDAHAAVAGWLARQSDQARERVPPWPLYVVAEKILGEFEILPRHWAVHGTTGYDFMNTLGALFVDQAAEGEIDALLRNFARWPHDFLDTVYRSKKKMMEHSLGSELHSLCYRAKQVAALHRHGRDFLFEQLHAALWEIIGTFPIYRTYITERSLEPCAAEKEVIEKAVAAAVDRRPELPREVFDFLRALLTLENLDGFRREDRPWCLRWIMRFQQLTGPVMAKGLEDTAFYNYHRLISLNEVGGNPATFAITVEEFHRRNLNRQERWPHSLLATATHDTKRGEDVRARINVLSEIPGDWREAVERWNQMNSGKKEERNGALAPDLNDEYLLYQTLVGAWPWQMESGEERTRFRERIAAYMLKAARESKRCTSWLDPDAAYERALQSFVESVLAPGPNPFVADVAAFQRRTSFFGVFNSLAQTLLKMTGPGVPDFYQGSELWDLSLVDPDNRRPVDYALRRSLLAELKQQFEQDEPAADPQGVEALLQNPADGRIKLYLVWRTLRFRAANEEVFASGKYVPLAAGGRARQHVCAFLRAAEREMIVAVPRLMLKLARGREQAPVGEEIWGDTTLELPPTQRASEWRNLFTGEAVSAQSELPARDVFRRFPVALLERV